MAGLLRARQCRQMRGSGIGLRAARLVGVRAVVTHAARRDADGSMKSRHAVSTAAIIDRATPTSNRRSRRCARPRTRRDRADRCGRRRGRCARAAVAVRAEARLQSNRQQQQRQRGVGVAGSMSRQGARWCRAAVVERANCAASAARCFELRAGGASAARPAHRPGSRAVRRSQRRLRAISASCGGDRTARSWLLRRRRARFAGSAGQRDLGGMPASFIRPGRAASAHRKRRGSGSRNSVRATTARVPGQGRRRSAGWVGRGGCVPRAGMRKRPSGEHATPRSFQSRLSRDQLPGRSLLPVGSSSPKRGAVGCSARMNHHLAFGSTICAWVRSKPTSRMSGGR